MILTTTNNYYNLAQIWCEMCHSIIHRHYGQTSTICPSKEENTGSYFVYHPQQFQPYLDMLLPCRQQERIWLQTWNTNLFGFDWGIWFKENWQLCSPHNYNVQHILLANIKIIYKISLLIHTEKGISSFGATSIFEVYGHNSPFTNFSTHLL